MQDDIARLDRPKRCRFHLKQKVPRTQCIFLIEASFNSDVMVVKPNIFTFFLPSTVFLVIVPGCLYNHNNGDL